VLRKPRDRTLQCVTALLFASDQKTGTAFVTKAVPEEMAR
jgi:hypothetical protein